MTLQAQILKLLAHADYQPLEKVGLSKQLGIEPGQRRHLRDALAELERDGQIARIRKNYFVLPVTAT